MRDAVVRIATFYHEPVTLLLSKELGGSELRLMFPPSFSLRSRLIDSTKGKVILCFDGGSVEYRATSHLA